MWEGGDYHPYNDKCIDLCQAANCSADRTKCNSRADAIHKPKENCRNFGSGGRLPNNAWCGSPDGKGVCLWCDGNRNSVQGALDAGGGKIVNKNPKYCLSRVSFNDCDSQGCHGEDPDATPQCHKVSGYDCDTDTGSAKKWFYAALPGEKTCLCNTQWA